MGAIIKFVLILIIVLYLINKVGKFFYELFFPEKAAQQKQRSNQRTTSQQQDHREGDIHIPREQSSKDKKFKGGDYVDFEEVD
jgi:Na+-transporting methylmalonyl-CoA/oxaloacetate decarboxylase gamma subunit